MTEIQELDVTIAPDGTVRVEVRGVRGPGCLEVTAPLEQVLGGEILLRERTSEFEEESDFAGTENVQTQGNA